MLLDVAGFAFAAGLMAFVFSCAYRRLECWGISLFTVGAGEKWALRLLGIVLMLASWALFSYSLSMPMPYVMPVTHAAPANYFESAGASYIEPMDYLLEPAPSDLDLMTYGDDPVEEWLSLMDQANYEDAWAFSAPSLQRSLNVSEFRKLAESRRAPLGGVIDRVRTVIVDLSALPDGREGTFKLHVYRTKFASGAQLEEIVVAEAQSDEWKILNYNLERISK